MNINGIEIGDVIQFVTKVERSGEGQPIQNVMLKVTAITDKYIRGVNAIRTIRANDGQVYRTYRLNNIAEGTVWKMIA